MRTRVAVVGAQGAVGQEIMSALEDLPTPVALQGFEHPQAQLDEDAEEILERLDDVAQLSAYDVVVLAVPAAQAAEIAPQLVADIVVIDLSDAHAAPEAGWTLLDLQGPPPESARWVLPSAEAELAASCLRALGRARAIERAHLCFLESASGLGREGLEALRAQTIDLLSFREPKPGVFGGRAAFDLLSAGETGGLRAQIAQLTGLTPQALQIQRARVPAFIGLSVSLQVVWGEGEGSGALPAQIDRVAQVLPSLDQCAGRAEIALGQPAPDALHAQGLNLWASCDNLARTAAQVAQAVQWAVAQVEGEA